MGRVNCMNLFHSRDVVITIFARCTSNFEVQGFLEQGDLTFWNKFLKSEAKKMTLLISEAWFGLDLSSKTYLKCQSFCGQAAISDSKRKCQRANPSDN